MERVLVRIIVPAAASGQLGAMFSGADEEQIERLSRWAGSSAPHFRYDDIIDIDSDPDELGKVRGTDVREGVRTLPMLYALRETGPDADRLRELLAGPVENDADVAEALWLLHKSNGMAQAKATVPRYAAQARDELANLPAGEGRDALAAVVDNTINWHG